MRTSAHSPLPVRLTLSAIAMASMALTGCEKIAEHWPLRGYKISSSAMQPTIYAGDKIMVDQTYYHHHPIADGDIIVLHHNGYVIVKRVSALSGETIEGRAGVLFRNGAALKEPYVEFSREEPMPALETFAARKIPPGEIFVTGDSRDHSLDSRSEEFGPVLVTDVSGQALYIYASDHPGQSGKRF